MPGSSPGMTAPALSTVRVMLPSASLPVFSVLSVVLAFTVTAVSPAIAAPAEPPVLAQAPSPDDGAAAKRRQQMSGVRNWGYWLSSFEVSGVAAAPHELMVIDNEISADRSLSASSRRRRWRA